MRAKLLRDHRAHAELRRRERRVLAARALAVVVAGDDEASAPLVRALRELRVAVLEGELGDRGHVRAVGHHGRAVGREVAGRDVVGDHDQHPHLQLVRQRLLLGRRLDVRAARDLDRARPRRRAPARGCAVWTTSGRAGGRRERSAAAELARVGDHAGEHRGRGDRGRAEVDLIVGRAAAAGEVAVEGAQRVDPDGGAWPMPTHGPQAGSSMRTPAISRST